MQESPVIQSSNEELFPTLIEQIAAREDTNPVDLTPPLYSAIDPDAVNGLLDSLDTSESSAHIEFTYLGYEIRIESDRTFDISEL